jgi:hypothetical protein
MRHAGALGIALGEVDHAVGHIAAEDRRARRGLGGPGLAEQGVPDMGLEGQQLLEGEAALRPGGHAAGHLRGLDGDGAAAAAGSYRGSGDSPSGSQPLAAIMAAARVSFSGASPLSSRQPRLNSGSPEVSM